MKKFIALIFAACFITGAAFCDPGLNLNAGVGITSSIILKPYANVDVNVDYEFENGIGVGGGVKSNFNVMPTRTKDKEFLESICYISPYILMKYGFFTAEMGLCLQKDTENPFQNFYAHLGGDFPIWQAGKGKVGLNFGLEGWMSLYAIDPEDDSAEQNFAAGLGTIFTTLFNTIKVDFGVKYYLPF